MKTWRQLEEMAKRQGLRLQHSTAVFDLHDKDDNTISCGDLWFGGRTKRSRGLRTMCEAALVAIGGKP